MAARGAAKATRGPPRLATEAGKARGTGTRRPGPRAGGDAGVAAGLARRRRAPAPRSAPSPPSQITWGRATACARAAGDEIKRAAEALLG